MKMPVFRLFAVPYAIRGFVGILLTMTLAARCLGGNRRCPKRV